MLFIADLHIHSKYSRATSKFSDIPNLYKYALIKGINVLGTGDFTHPAWFQEIKEYLIPDGKGLFDLKEEVRREILKDIPYLSNSIMKFILSVEISSIYKKNGKVRKIHNVILMPDLESVEKFNKKLEGIGNIHSDGRPILGLDSKTLFEIALEVNPDIMFIPAHIWTPWFSLFGAKSGFDDIKECFEDLTDNITALETGLSSDPPMNWRLSMIDKFNLVSNSDAHSPDNLAREANLFNTELSYKAIFNALKNKESKEFLGTVEFFPEEGKYHLDGHRNCGVRLTPKEAIKNNLICPVCGKPITIGVLHRVEELADREEGEKPPIYKDFESLVPLKEIIAEAMGIGKNSVKVLNIYNGLIEKLGSELHILRDISIEDIKEASSEIIAEGIRRVRNKEIELLAGFDGEYGQIKIFTEDERTTNAAQMLLISQKFLTKKDKLKPRHISIKRSVPDIKIETIEEEIEIKNVSQEEAIKNEDYPEVVIAGPGSGKTYTLIQKVIYLIKEKNLYPENILAFTFTNKAASEILERVKKEIPDSEKIKVGTFHSIAYEILKENNIPFEIFDDNDVSLLIKRILNGLKIKKSTASIINKIKLIKTNLQNINNEEEEFKKIFDLYQTELKKYNGMDYEDIIIYTLRLFKDSPEVLQKYHNKYKFILIDEFQDITILEYKFVIALSNKGKNLFIIGDPDQSIYKFRGAKPELLKSIISKFNRGKKIYLNINYRNPSLIFKGAAAVIKDISEFFNKEDINIITTSRVKEKINILKAPTELSAAIQTAKLITELTGGSNMAQSDMLGELFKTYSFSDIAILVRLSSQIPLLEETLITEGIPYKILGAKSFLDTTGLRAIINFIRLLMEPFNKFRLIQIITTPFFKIEEKLIKEIENEENPKIIMNDILNKSKNSNLHTLSDIYMELIGLEPDNRPDQIFKIINFPEIKNFNRLKQIALSFNTVGDFLKNILLGKEQDIDYANNLEKETVSILTLHSAKGLEFPVVIIFEVNDGIIPYTEREYDLDEERRLFYVGMTRSKEKLYLIIPAKIKRYGKEHLYSESRFISYIPDDIINKKEIKFKKKEEDNQLSFWK